MVQYFGGQPYTPAPVPQNPDDIPRYLESEFYQISAILADLGKVAWGGTYRTGQCFAKGTMVQDDGWTMIANKDTCERPAPQPAGGAAWLIPGAPSWQAETYPAATVYTGARYTYPQSMFINSVRVWYPSTANTVFYKLTLIINPDDPVPRVQEIDWHNAPGGIDWGVVGIGQTPVPEGTVLEVILQTQNRTGQSEFSGDWNYITPNNETIPLAGQIQHANKALGSFRIHKVDANGGDRSTELETLKAGDEITGAGIKWSIASAVDNGTWMDFTVSPAIQANTDGIHTFIFTEYELQPAPYVRLIDYWSAATEVSGMLGDDPNSLLFTDDAYGVDINIQDATVPNDWDMVSAP